MVCCHQKFELTLCKVRLSPRATGPSPPYSGGARTSSLHGNESGSEQSFLGWVTEEGSLPFPCSPVPSTGQVRVWDLQDTRITGKPTAQISDSTKGRKTAYWPEIHCTGLPLPASEPLMCYYNNDVDLFMLFSLISAGNISVGPPNKSLTLRSRKESLRIRWKHILFLLFAPYLHHTSRFTELI